MEILCPKASIELEIRLQNLGQENVDRVTPQAAPQNPGCPKTRPGDSQPSLTPAATNPAWPPPDSGITQGTPAPTFGCLLNVDCLIIWQTIAHRHPRSFNQLLEVGAGAPHVVPSTPGPPGTPCAGPQGPSGWFPGTAPVGDERDLPRSDRGGVFRCRRKPPARMCT